MFVHLSTYPRCSLKLTQRKHAGRTVGNVAESLKETHSKFHSGGQSRCGFRAGELSDGIILSFAENFEQVLRFVIAKRRCIQPFKSKGA